jgi:5-methylcytosine-specific restriction endonuclease McrA
MEEKQKILNKKFKEQKGKCFWCNAKLSLEIASIIDYYSIGQIIPKKCIAKDEQGNVVKGVFDFHDLDHVLPKSLGGTDNPDNLVLSCRRCNQRKLGNLWLKDKHGSIVEFNRPKKKTKIEYKNNKIIITTVIKLYKQ